MALPASYLVLRRGLLARLAVSGVLTLAAVVLAWSLAPREGDQAARAAAVPSSVPAVPGSSAPASLPASPPRATPSAAALVDAMRSVHELEPLDGKALEVLAQRSTIETEPEAASGAAGDAPQKASTQLVKLPKGPHLQAGIFASTANAEEMRKKLEAAGYPAYLETRVHIGPFQNRRDADKARELLKEQGTTTLFIPQ